MSKYQQLQENDRSFLKSLAGSCCRLLSFSDHDECCLVVSLAVSKFQSGFVVQVPGLYHVYEGLKVGRSKIWHNSMVIPSYVALASTVVLVLHVILASSRARKLWARITRREVVQENSADEPVFAHRNETDITNDFAEHVAQHGGFTIFSFRVLRLLSCLVLLGLSVYTAIKDEDSITNAFGKKGKGKHGRKHRDKDHRQLSDKEWADLLLTMTYFYALSLAALVVASTPKWATIITRHLNTVLLAFCGVYIYRDIYPLITFDRVPADKAEGLILWVKVGAIFFSAVAIPLAIPRRYVPADPADPMPEPNPEQTASLFSVITFSFLDPIVKLANRVPVLTADLLPPLSDSDRAKVLKARAFPHIDSFVTERRRHIFFGLMRVFGKEYAFFALMLVLNVLAGFASPLGIKNLLHYLETGGRDSAIKPWFWILWLLLGPYLATTAMQLYIYVATRIVVQAECLITQLLFEHSLRIRFKAEAGEPNKEEDNGPDSTVTEVTTPDAASVAGTQEASEADTLVHSQGTTESTITPSNSAKKDKINSAKANNEEGPSRANNLIGKINNLVTSDLGNITGATDFLFILVYIPLKATLSMVLLYTILGWSAMVGLAVMVICLPLPGYVAKLIQDVQVARMKKTDARLQSVSETMNILRMVKLFGWERKMDDVIREKREEELSFIWKRQVFGLFANTLCSYLIPLFTMMSTYATIVMKKELNASIVFSSMTVFDMLQQQLHMSFFFVNRSIAGRVSLDRVNDFLQKTELLDAFTRSKASSIIPTQVATQNDGIGFHDASFTWPNDGGKGSLTPSKREFTLRVEGDLFFPRGQISLIVGPTGSGKTSLLMALLGEMHFVPTAPDSWFNLPRSGGIAYAAQESWVQNETIKENILFGSPCDEERYQKVIHQCGLARDLSLFEAGDQTEVGEKGLTLSGGQKARITLARAVYSKAEILLLDDILAALDVHTSKWIVEKCLAGDLVKGRTVVMVTHNVALASTVAQFVVSFGGDGKILSQGSISDALKNNKALVEEVEAKQELAKTADDEVDPDPNPSQPADGKLIVAEEMQEGHVSWDALKMYFSSLGGQSPFLFIFGYLAFVFLSEMTLAGQTWFLGYWAWEYTVYPPSDVPVIRNLGIYFALLLFSAVAYCLAFFIFAKGAIRASRTIHAQLVKSVLGTTLRWLDTTPVSRILTRCTQDIRTVDDPLPQLLRRLTGMTATMLVKLTAVVVLTPACLLPGVFVALVGDSYGRLYIQAQLAVKREMSNAKQPVLGHFGAAISGLTSLRAYGAQEAFNDRLLERIDRYSRVYRTHFNLNRWVCLRIDLLGSFFAAGLATYLVYFQDHTASNTGFSLNMAVGFSSLTLWWIRVLNDFEVQGNSLERIETYIQIEQEEKPSERGVPPAYWPADGSLHVENLCARYSPEGPKVLHNISFDVKSGERIGIVGRTGSGKSSLTLALLRCIFTEGTVVFAGQDTSKLNLGALRTNLTIIPQMPELLSGSLRQNLDPFEQFDDAALNAALTSAGLFSLQDKVEEGRITLDSSISSGGGNISVGQRQIIALARAIVRGSKLLILDEATSAIDHKTDAVIQSSLRNELGSDVTVLTVAHRLQTIMDSDKIMVLDAGRIVEFDKPADLLKDPKSKLRALVDESGDKEALQAMAGFENH
ncbi:ATP-binding cassette transporter [Coprinopsis sp. MPI-PUGE-AT-0042]|nr:ATP-binding cassette transporter [Coprinopsis sp. MPI-PUGE-AT-0042]